MIKKKSKPKSKSAAKDEKKAPRIEVREASDFRAIYASGVFGGLDPNDGRMIFFLDRIKPRMKKGEKNIMELEKVNRELQVEIHMSPNQFLSVAKWMNDHVQKAGKKIKAKKRESSTSYIG